MNIFLWVLQAALAFLSISGGAYKEFKVDELSKMAATRSIPPGLWRALGALEIACGVLLIVPVALDWMPILTPVAAAILAVENLGLAAHYGRYSLKLTGANPLVYVLVGGVMAAIVAYGRYGLVA